MGGAHNVALAALSGDLPQMNAKFNAQAVAYDHLNSVYGAARERRRVAAEQHSLKGMLKNLLTTNSADNSAQS